MGRVFTAVCLFACLFAFPGDIPKIDVARITKIDMQMFQDEAWKSIYFGSQKVKVQGLQTLRNIAGAAAYVSYAWFSLLFGFPCYI